MSERKKPARSVREKLTSNLPSVDRIQTRRSDLLTVDAMNKSSGDVNPTSFPIVDKETKMFTDDNGEQWITKTQLAKKLGLSLGLLTQFIGETDTIQAILSGGQLVTLYKSSSILSNPKLQNLLALPIADPNTHAAIIESESWVTRNYLRSKFGISYKLINKILHDISSRQGRSMQGKVVTLYPENEVLLHSEIMRLKSLPQVDVNSGIFEEGDEKWVTLGALAKKLNITHPTLKRLATRLKKRQGKDSVGKEVTLYSESEIIKYLEVYKPELRQNIQTEMDICEVNGERWIIRSQFMKRYSITPAILRKFLPNVRQIRSKLNQGKVVALFNESDLLNNKELQEFLQLPLVDLQSGIFEEAGEQWITKAELRKTIHLSHDKLNSFLSEIPTREGRGYNGRVVTLYKRSSLLAHVTLQRHIALQKADPQTNVVIIDGERWVTQHYLKDKYNLEYQRTRRHIRYASMKLGRDSTGQEVKIYNESEILNIPAIQEFLRLPEIDRKTGICEENGEQWVTLNKLAAETGKSMSTLRNYTHLFSHRYGKLLGHKTALFRTSEVLDYFNVRKNRDHQKHELIETINSLVSGETKESDEFKKLIEVFGGAYAVDILFKFHPEYKKIPLREVKSQLSEYLGNYLRAKGNLNLQDLEVITKHLSELTLQDALYELIKLGSLDSFNQNRREKTGNPAEDVINAYIDQIAELGARFKSVELQSVLSRVREYYWSVFHDFPKPSQIVEELKPGRQFPDVNQQVNVKEIHNKKKVLIADEMGMGKSASFILAKETLGVKTALVVVPSNVISTWVNYLSDNQDGYFKQGQAPKVLVVEDIKSLHLATTEGQSYDYVLISQERLKPQYIAELEKVEYGMLCVDEIHKLKKIKGGKRSQNLQRLAKKIHDKDQYMVLLSGTPVPNKVEDIAMILRLVYPELFQQMDDKTLVQNIIKGDIVDLRSLLLPRMQRKKLAESVNVPDFEEQIIPVKQTDLEKEVYGFLLEEEDLSAQAKLQLLRQYLLNHSILDATPGIPNAKIQRVSTELKKDFQSQRTVVMFVNGYIEGVIRGGDTIFSQLNLPEDVEVRVIEGAIDKKQRKKITDEIRKSGKKFLFVVSGQTSGVGEDFSYADASYIYNEPWTREEVKQEHGRVWREGVKHNIIGKTFVAEGTIEEGIHEYIREKEQAIEKLLQGMPISEMEQELLVQAEKQEDPNLEVNAELAKYYFSVWDKMKRIFAYVRELGEEEFKRFLEKYGKDYAEGYKEMGRRSYQANASRVSGALIHEMIRERGQSADQLTVLDIASGPEMLRKHSNSALQNQIISLDINPNHFAESSDDMHKVGSFLNLPFDDESIDYANLSLAFHYTNFIPGRAQLERLKILMEAGRVLKPGGKLVLNNINSLDIKDPNSFKEIMELIGFKIVEEYTGDVIEGEGYQSKVITLEKQQYYPTEPQMVIEAAGKEHFGGLRLTKNSSALKDSRRIITGFNIKGRRMNIDLNDEDKKVWEEEQALTTEGIDLKERYGSIREIPAEQIINNNFVRVLIGGKYILFKKLQMGGGVIVVK